MTAASNGNGVIQRGNMTVILSAAGLVMIAFGGFITFQSSATDRRISDLQADIKAITHSYLRNDEHAEFKLRLDKDISRIESARLRDMERVVPKDELNSRLSFIESNFRLISDRLNELRMQTTQTVTIRDELNRLQNELIEMRRALGDRKVP